MIRSLRNASATRLVNIIAGAVIAIVWLSAIIWINRLYVSEAQDAKRELSALAHVLADHTDRAIQGVDLALRSLSPKVATAANDPGALREILRSAFGGLPHVRASLILDAQGRSIGDSEQSVPRPFNGADRQYFRIHLSGSYQGLFIGPPVQSRINQKWAISLSRRLEHADGAFLGVVVVAVDPAYFSELYAAVEGLHVDSVNLVGRDHVLRAAFPADETALGRELTVSETGFESSAFGDTRGFSRTRGRIGDSDRHTAFQATTLYPLVVTVARSQATVVVAVTREAIAATVLALSLTILALFLHWDVCRRIGDAQRLASESDAARERAIESEQAKARFLANMSHELRTPLNAVIGFAELLQNPHIANTQQRRDEYAAHICEAGGVLLATVNEILDQARIEAGRVQLELEETDPYDTIRGAVRFVEGAASTAGVAIATRNLASDVRVIADTHRLRQVLVNLAANAVKFTPRGGHIDIAYETMTNGGVVIRVADTGIGMTEDQISHALEPFGRVANEHVRSREGTGLGLPIAKALTELQGARFAISSQLGKGTVIALEFPASLVRAATA